MREGRAGQDQGQGGEVGQGCISLEWSTVGDSVGEGSTAPISPDHALELARAPETYRGQNWGRVSCKAMLGSAPQYSAFGRSKEAQKQQPLESPFLSISTEIHMAINKSSYGFCAQISRYGAPEKIYERISGTQLNFPGLAGPVADRVLGHTNISPLSSMVFCNSCRDHKPDRTDVVKEESELNK